MTHAFTDSSIEQRRRKSELRKAQLAALARRGVAWGGAFVVSLLAFLVIAGFAESAALADPSAPAFLMPWDWFGLLAWGAPAIARTTGAAGVLFVGGWFSALGILLLRRVLTLDVWSRTPASGVLAVARGVVDEAMRHRVVVVLLTLLLLSLAFQPWISLGTTGGLLRQRVQAFLQFSGYLGTILLGGVTVLFSAYSVATDLSSKSSGDVFVKPVSRLGYLLGKWLGTALLMLVLVAVWGGTTWGVTRFWVAQTPALDRTDREELENRTLVARRTVLPMPEVPFQDRARLEMERIAREDPERYARQSPQDLFEDLIYRELVGFLTIPFGETRGYVFDGLDDVRDRALAVDADLKSRRDEVVAVLDTLNVTIRPEEVSLGAVLAYADELGFDPSDVLLQVRFKIEGASAFNAAEEIIEVSANGVQDRLRYVVDLEQVYDIPGTLIDEEGTLTLEIANGPLDASLLDNLPDAVRERQGPLRFDPEVRLTAYSNQGSFGVNLFKAGIVLWVRLAFLAMLGTATAALFSFPVASLFSISVWLLSAGGQWIESILYGSLTRTGFETVESAFDRVLMPAVRGVVSVFARFSEVRGTDSLREGLAIGWGSVGSHVVWIGIGWIGVVLLLGWFAFSRREIARVQV
jgi:ABC-type transport system involved in multi-copper enzyme maturation permease subunit